MKKQYLIGIIVIVMILLLTYIIRYSKLEYTENIEKLTNIRRNAYEYALICSGIKNPKLKFEDIRWIIVLSNKMRISTVDGDVILSGYFSSADSVIYIINSLKSTKWALAHESLHAIGVIDHPNFPFRYPCRLMPDQHT